MIIQEGGNILNYYGTGINDSARIPIQPLPYENKALAENKELLVDYNNGNLYVISDGKEIDITANIINLINSGNTSNSEVTIDGLGTVKLARLLELLWENRITFSSSEQTSIYLPKGKQVDFKSISIKDSIIQISNFDNADNNSIPIKIGNNIYWRKAATANSTELDPVQGDGNSIDYKNGVLTIVGFNEAHSNQVLAKIDGKVKFININPDGSFGMTDEEKVQLTDNTTDISTLKKLTDEMNTTLVYLKETNADNLFNVEELVKKYSDLSVKLENCISNVDDASEILDHIDYDKVVSDINAINDCITDLLADKIDLSNRLSEINTRINSISSTVDELNEIVLNHLCDTDLHSSVHFIEDMPVDERINGHLYIKKKNKVVNDFPTTYIASLRSEYSNIGADVEFKIGESSNYRLNDDLAIQEEENNERDKE